MRRTAILAVSLAASMLALFAGACAVKKAVAEPDARAAEVRQGFPIDRRPVYMLRLWNGSYDEPGARGLSRAFRGDDAPERIVERLDALYEEGWRRIMMTHPAGAPEHATQWGTIEQWVERSEQWQEGMRIALARWLADRPDATLGVYMGLRKQDGAFPTTDELSLFLGPWLAGGISEFGFDASAKPEALLEFDRVETWLRARGARAVMEALPTTEDGAPDLSRLSRHPAMALARFIGSRAEPDGWRFDPGATEVWVGVGRTAALHEEAVREWQRRGYVLLVYSANERDRELALRLSEEAVRPR